jgi:arylsulfatase A-like enzyme
VTPPRDYLDLYHRLGVDEPVVGEWAADFDRLPHALKRHHAGFGQDPTTTMLARQGFFAQCTYIDHQMRLLIGELREEGLLDDTIVMFVSDHGDMIGNHRLWSKPPMLECSAKIPMILMPTAAYDRVGHHVTDDRLAELRDVMPTLLDLCGIPIPNTVEGLSLASEARRDHLYCEHDEDDKAMRMIRCEQYKLIWYPFGNHVQLFDLESDPQELHDVSDEAPHDATRERLTDLLVQELYGVDLDWVENGRLVGTAEPKFEPSPNRGLSGQRGWR